MTHKSAIIQNDDLCIDNWTEKHYEDGHLIEKYEGQLIMKLVSEQKYLGIVLSKDGSNIKKI